MESKRQEATNHTVVNVNTPVLQRSATLLGLCFTYMVLASIFDLDCPLKTKVIQESILAETKMFRT